MRNIFIALVLFVTALTFYSALWFKSTSIENDITQRVTDELDATDARNVAVDVDGRHVTLSGVVYDEAVENAHLATADTTWGALGPIDGLTYLADGGYISAVKDEAGITLRGTVPNDDVRATLLENATAATDGTVDDQMVVSGPAAAWQDEAAFGLLQLAGLTTGTLSAATGAYALSGTTDGDPAGVQSAFADREGWQAVVSSPMALRDMTGTMDRLNTDLALRDATISGLENTVEGQDTQIGILTQERDAFGTDLADLRASLSEGEADTSSLRAELGVSQSSLADAQAMIVEKDQIIADTGVAMDGLNGRVAELETELTARGTALGATDQQVLTLQGNLEVANQASVDLTAQVEARDQTIANFTGLVQDRDALITDNAALVDGLNGRVAELETELADRGTALGATDQQVLTLQGDLEVANQASVDLTAQVEARDQTIANFTGLVGERDGTIADLTGAVDARDQTIAEMRDAAGNSESEQVAALSAQIQTRDGTITELTSQVADTRGEVTRLSGELADRDGSLAQTATQLAALTAAAQSGSGDVAALQSEVSGLTAVVAEREATIAALQSSAATSAPVAGMSAEQCATRANVMLQDAQINFDTNTATIQAGSVPLLERLTGIALACVGDGGLTVEVGGHTDSQGSDENNQVLSEARAQAIVAFMAARGVPSEGLQAVGYGEVQPIGDNETDAGRAANRRISFEWQAR